MALTREDLINDLFRQIINIENKPQNDKSRGYVLDLLAEIANAIDGKRPNKGMKISDEAIEHSSKTPAR
jgi:hypothetical protein